MARFIDPLYTSSFLDANIFDEVAYGKNDAVQKILQIYDEDHINLLMAYSVQDELNDHKTPEGVKKAAQSFIFSVKVTLTKPEQDLYEKLLKEVTGNAERKNIGRDLFHVFEAQKYGAGHFVTLDKRLLKRRATISNILGVDVITPEEFVKKVRFAQEQMKRLEEARRGSKT